MENSLTVYASLAKLINQTHNKFDEIQLKPEKDYGMWITDARPCRRSLVKQQKVFLDGIHVQWKHRHLVQLKY